MLHIVVLDQACDMPIPRVGVHFINDPIQVVVEYAGSWEVVQFFPGTQCVRSPQLLGIHMPEDG